MKIKRLIANWFYTPDGDGYDTYEVGKYNVIKITEHTAQGSGDKWFYDVEFLDNKTRRIFNPNSVDFEEVT